MLKIVVAIYTGEDYVNVVIDTKATPEEGEPFITSIYGSSDRNLYNYWNKVLQESCGDAWAVSKRLRRYKIITMINERYAPINIQKR